MSGRRSAQVWGSFPASVHIKASAAARRRHRACPRAVFGQRCCSTVSGKKAACRCRCLGLRSSSRAGRTNARRRSVSLRGGNRSSIVLSSLGRIVPQDRPAYIKMRAKHPAGRLVWFSGPDQLRGSAPRFLDALPCPRAARSTNGSQLLVCCRTTSSAVKEIYTTYAARSRTTYRHTGSIQRDRRLSL